jgi:hypothetical protein
MSSRKTGTTFLLFTMTAVMSSGCYGVASMTGAVDDSTPGSETPTISTGNPPRPDTTSGTVDPIGPDGLPNDEQPSSCVEPAPIRSPVRRLTGAEYDNTVLDLLGVGGNPASAFVSDSIELGFDNNAEANIVSPLLLEQYVTAAEQISEQALAKPSLLPCTPTAATEATCALSFIDRFGAKAFRRPLTAEERTKLNNLYREGRSKGTFSTGIQYVIQAALLSPPFLYRVELGTPETFAGAVKLSGYEIASRLSYLFWASMPDEALFNAAAAGELSTPEGIALQARRLLASPRARTAVARFTAQWLSLDQVEQLKKDSIAFPQFTPAVAASMRQEAERYVDDIFWNGAASIGSLLTSTHSYVDANLAPLYGVSAVAGWQRVQLDATRRVGLLTRSSTLAANAHENQTSPVLRGKFIRERLLCQTLPPPPADVNVELPQLDPNLTTRERFAQHRAAVACQGCHTLMDPLGLGFENFDAVGRWRDTENEKPIDATGELTSTSVPTSPFDGAAALSAKLAALPDLDKCMARQWFRYTFGRAETAADNCTLELLNRELVASKGNMRDLLVAFTRTDAFLYRTPFRPEEVSP